MAISKMPLERKRFSMVEQTTLTLSINVIRPVELTPEWNLKYPTVLGGIFQVYYTVRCERDGSSD